MEQQPEIWRGKPPEYCDVCGTKLDPTAIFYEVRLRSGGFAIIDEYCNNRDRRDLWLGHGKPYHKQAMSIENVAATHAALMRARDARDAARAAAHTTQVIFDAAWRLYYQATDRYEKTKNET